MRHIYCYLLLFLNTFLFAQQTDYVDFKSANAHLTVNPEARNISGNLEYTFDVLKAVDSIFLDSRNLTYKSILLNDKEISFYTKKGKLWIIKDFHISKNNVLKIEYEAFPKKAMYFVGWDNGAPDQVWTQGQGKYTSNWLPSFDDVNEKIEFDLKIQVKKPYQVIANGKLTNIEILSPSGYNIWHYDMKQPMSSYLLAIVIGEYDKKLEYTESGIPIEMYYYTEDSLKFEPTYRYTKQIFDFLEKEIGVPYPWQNYKIVPVHDFLYAGMENTGTTIFSDGFMTDEIGFLDRNFVNVNAHELAHQWFGNLVTSKTGTHHWLQEGFATYYALQAERDVFGEDYYYWRLYEYALELLSQDESGKSTSLLNPKSSSATFYKKGAWTLHILREKVGDKAFNKAVKRYLKKHQYKNVESKDFLVEVEEASGKDLTQFVNDWLLNDQFAKDPAYRALRKNKFVNEMLKLEDIDIGSVRLFSICDSVLKSDSFFPFQQKLFSRIKNTNSPEAIQIFKKAFRTKDVKKRQAIALNLKEIPFELKKDYETLLDDKSYVTIEAALFNLWNSFPQDQEIYLNRTKDIMGFSDKNVRTLWLALAILTDNDSMGDPELFLNELVSYTASDYNFEVRQNAFRYLRWIRSCGDKCMDNLEEASNHHNWRFKQFAKQILESY